MGADSVARCKTIVVGTGPPAVRCRQGAAQRQAEPQDERHSGVQEMAMLGRTETEELEADMSRQVEESGQETAMFEKKVEKTEELELKAGMLGQMIEEQTESEKNEELGQGVEEPASA